MAAAVAGRPLRRWLAGLAGLVALGFLYWLVAPQLGGLGRRMGPARRRPLRPRSPPHHPRPASTTELLRSGDGPPDQAVIFPQKSGHSVVVAVPGTQEPEDTAGNSSFAPTTPISSTLPVARSLHLAALMAGPGSTAAPKMVDMLALAQRGGFHTLGCEGRAVCPALVSCSQQRFMCSHNPLNVTEPPDFPLKQYYPEAFQDTRVLVLPNALQEWNGNVAGLQKGGRPTHYALGMCPWGSITVARTEVLSMTLHVPRAASLIHVYAANFYHFLAETLPRYYTLLPLLRAYPETRLIIAHKWARLIDLFFPADHLSGRSINMKMWGAGKPKTKPRRDSKVYKYVFADQFFVTVQPKCGMPPMVAVAELRRDYLTNVRPRLLASGDAGREGWILLYSRNNFTSRRALRENQQLYEALAAAFSPDLVRYWYGIWPSRLAATAGPLARASVLVGPHGAGLAALLFLPAGGSALELRQDHRHDPHSCFQALAFGAGVPFDFVFGRGTRDTPLSVNVTEVVERVQRLRAAHWTP